MKQWQWISFQEEESNQWRLGLSGEEPRADCQCLDGFVGASLEILLTGGPRGEVGSGQRCGPVEKVPCFGFASAN